MLFPGWTILRAIPSDAWVGLLTKQYTITGGVVRWASGTAKGGQIVAHLLPAATNLFDAIPGVTSFSGIVSNVQLFQIASQVSTLSAMTGQVLNLVTGTAILSGLNLAVSCIGFSVINNKLNTIDNRLKKIEKGVREVHEFLQLGERAKLQAALKDLLGIDNMTNFAQREKVLDDRRQTLMELNLKYRALFQQANTIATAIADEEYFSLTALAYTRCAAELGMRGVAEEMEEINTFWKTQARRIAKEVLIGKYPERFLASDFAEVVPVSMLVEWLDFAHDDKKEYDWIDELRRKINEPWYPDAAILGFLANNVAPGFLKKEGSGLNQGIGIGLEKEKTVIIPALQKLVARNNIFDGYTAQYQMLEEYNLKPSEFERKLKELPEAKAINGYFILVPE